MRSKMRIGMLRCPGFGSLPVWILPNRDFNLEVYKAFISYTTCIEALLKFEHGPGCEVQIVW